MALRDTDGLENSLEIRGYARSGYFWAAVAVILIAITGFGRVLLRLRRQAPWLQAYEKVFGQLHANFAGEGKS